MAPASLGVEVAGNEIRLRLSVGPFPARTRTHELRGVLILLAAMAGWVGVIGASLVYFEGDDVAMLLPLGVAAVGIGALVWAARERVVPVRLTPHRVTIGSWSAPVAGIAGASVEVLRHRDRVQHLLVVVTDTPVRWLVEEDEASWVAAAVALLVARDREPPGEVPEALRALVSDASR